LFAHGIILSYYDLGMLRPRVSLSKISPDWMRVIIYTTPIFFYSFSDSILSYYAPIAIQAAFGSAMIMGLVMSFSSVVGLVTDFIFPQILKEISAKRLLLWSGFLSLAFAVLLLGAGDKPLYPVFLLAMAIWGVYYEFLGFSKQKFMGTKVPRSLHSGANAFMFTMRGVSYTFGPLLAAFMFGISSQLLIGVSIAIAVVGVFLSIFTNHSRGVPVEVEVQHVHLGAELSHWKVLMVSVWPMVLLFIGLGLVDAAFWTTGTVLSQKFAETTVLGDFLIPIYVLPALIIGLVVAKWNPVEGKKKLATLFFLLSGIFLGLVGVIESIPLILVMVFISSVLSSISYPLVDAVFSDLTERMGKERFHLIGLTNSATSIAYIIGPLMAGFMASRMGEEKTFGALGVITVVLSIIIYFATPRKIKLSQENIKKWD